MLGFQGDSRGATPYQVGQLQLPQTWVFYDARHLSEDGRAGAYVRISNETLPIDVPAVWSSAGVFSALSVPFTYAQAYVQGFAPNSTALGNLISPSVPNPVPVLWGNFGLADVTLVEHFGAGGAVTAASDTRLIGETADPTQSGYVYRLTEWDLDGTSPRLVTGLPDGRSRANSANTSGAFVGSMRATASPNTPQAIVGRNGTAWLLNFPGFNTLSGLDINNEDWMVGGWRPAPGAATRSFIAKAFGDEIYDLGVLPGYAGTTVRAINDDGVIVGSTADAFGRALYWHPGTTTPVDFNTMVNIPGETLVEAIDINNAGQILARGFNGYYILTPTVPEPLAVAMFAMAIPLLASRRRVCIGRDRADNSAACPTL